MHICPNCNTTLISKKTIDTSTHRYINGSIVTCPKCAWVPNNFSPCPKNILWHQYKMWLKREK